MRQLIILIIPFVFFSCKKEEDRDCFKSIGDSASREVSVGEFDKLNLGPHLAYVLVQDTVNRVVVTGGSNLINLIDVTIDDNMQLHVMNNNDCNFLRDYDDVITVEIHVKKIINIHFEGTQPLVCENQLKTDYLTLTIRDGAGEVNLDVDAIELWTLVTYGWGNFNFKGEVDYLNIQLGGDGFGTTYDLTVRDSLHAISNTTGLLKVNADSCDFVAQNILTGDIWYVGNPTSVTHATYGGGELLNKN